jgi:glycosyltransferase involved in cell wall biosynthesis
MSQFVIIPAHNEEKNIKEVIQKVKTFTKNIVIVDDGSDDNTAKIVKKEGIFLLQHSVNLGKGAALKTGCDYATKNGATQIVVIDADGQHEPNDIPRFFEALNDSEIVFGYRKQAKSMPFILKVGNKFINETLNSLFRIKIYDSQCGYRAFTTSAYKKVRWTTKDYFMETEMIVRAGKNKLVSKQIPIATIYGDKYKGTTVKDGLIIVGKMIAWRLLK